jgi:hypothetical protein
MSEEDIGLEDVVWRWFVKNIPWTELLEAQHPDSQNQINVLHSALEWREWQRNNDEKKI